MLINLFFLLVSLFVLLFAPSDISLFIDLFLYTSIVWYQYCFKQNSSSNLIILFSYLILNILYYVFKYNNVLPFTGVVVYSVFSLKYFLNLIGYVFKRNTNEMILECVSLCFTLVSILLSFLLKPDFSYVYVPIVIFATVTLLRSQFEKSLNFIFSQKTNSLFCYTYSGYTIKQIVSKQDLETFKRILKSNYEEIYQNTKTNILLNKRKSKHEFLININNESIINEKHMLLLIYNEKCDPIGTFKLSYSKPLPIENELDLNLDPIYKTFGKSGEIGRFSIIENYRSHPLLIEAVFKSLAKICMHKEIIFLFCQGMINTISLYQKVGFIELKSLINSKAEPKSDKEFGLLCVPMYINIANKISKMVEHKFNNLKVHNSTDFSNTNHLFNDYINKIDNKYKSKKENYVPIASIKYIPQHLVNEIFK